MKEWDTLAVCTDCLMAAANGINDPHAVWGEGFRERWEAAGARHGRPLVAACSEPDHIDPIDLVCVNAHFSWSPCDWCGDHLGGDRFCASVEVTA